MHRVELKELSGFYEVFDYLVFLMHRVELKALRSGMKLLKG